MIKKVGIGFAAVGLLLLAVAAWTAMRQYTILKHWPVVDAEVMNSRVVEGTDSDGMASYRAAIQFRYSVGGKEYLTPASSNISTSSYASVKQEVDRYPQGTHHPIRHKPDDPNEISFDAGYSMSFFFLPILFGGMGIVFAGVGAAVVISSRA